MDEHENQFSVGNLSGIQHQQKADTPLVDNESDVLGMLKQSVDPEKLARIASKRKYLAGLNKSNEDMKNHIQQINDRLSEQVKKIEANIVHHPTRNKQKITFQRSKQLEAGYAEIDALKKQIKIKTAQKQSMANLEQRYDSLKAQYKKIYTELQQKEHNLAKLQKMIKLKQSEDSNMAKTGSELLTGQEREVKELKQQIKKQSERVYSRKQQFIKLHKKNKSQSTHQITQLSSMRHTDESGMSPEAEQLKREYEIIGKRIQLLKIQKLSLMMKDDNIQKKQRLGMLKMKYAEICKL